MKTKTRSIGALTGPFVSSAAARGARAPLRLIGQDAHGWQVASRQGDALVLDEFGDLWWARIKQHDARVIRACWPEEAGGLADQISKSLASYD